MSFLTASLRRSACVAAACAVATLPLAADVIFFVDGGADEGHVSIENGKVSVRSRQGQGEYAISTSLVKEVRYDIWLNEMDKARDPVSITFAAATTSPVVRTGVSSSESWEPGVSRGPTGPGFSAQRNPAQYAKNIKKRFKNLGPLFATVLLLAIVGTLIWFVVSFACWNVVVADAFREGEGWGFLALLVPLGFQVYIFLRYTGRRIFVFCMFHMIVLWIALSGVSLYLMMTGR